jgi:hypothetical protein
VERISALRAKNRYNETPIFKIGTNRRRLHHPEWPMSWKRPMLKTKPITVAMDVIRFRRSLEF